MAAADSEFYGALANVVLLPAMFLTTAYMPHALMPRWLQLAVSVNPLTYVIEGARGRFLKREVYELLGEHGAALVIGDHPKWPFQARELTTDWTLVRLHHGHRGRRGNYSETEVEEWARRIAQWRRRAEVLVYFNNDWEGFAVDNARSLKRRLRPSPGD
jgi:uncharacterized protein YecE (DUF72 family)